MDRLEGYRLGELLYRSPRSTVRRAHRRADDLAVVVKRLEPSADAENVARFRYAYEILRSLSLDGVARALALEQHDGCPTLVMEDIGGRSLDQLGPIDRRQALQLAIEVVRVLGRLHQENIIHQDIKPSNVVYSEVSGRCQLIDFDLASRLSREVSELRGSTAFRGTLGFVSPEQTGRTNRGIDYRTDFYSFGATLFFLLTGRPPFEGTDPLALVHSHVALPPPRLTDLDATIPEAVSDVVAKLLSKAPEERYQSAYGLEADLKECLERVSASGDHVTRGSFEAGRHDVSAHFTVSEKLYGRESQVARLVGAFERAVSGRPELVLVSGSPGVGKSSVVSSMHRPIAERSGTFLEGKFEPLQNLPYAALDRAFQQWTRDLLTETAEGIDRWRDKLLEELGSIGRVIIERVPELETIVGPQPDVPELGGTEAQNRLRLAYLSLLRVACSRGPVVIFLDDLQWASSASFHLLETFLTNGDLEGLLIVGAYRDGEVASDHPLRRTLDVLEGGGIPVSEIVLEPLDRSSVEHVVADTLGARAEMIAELADIAFSRTHGNPFFLRRFLVLLHEQGAIDFDPEGGRWRWDIGRVEEAGISDNVAELLSQELARLPQATRDALSLAACLGGKFDLRRLARAADLRPAAVAEALWPALEKEALVPIGEGWRAAAYLDPGELARMERITYRFPHDRVLEAAYGLLSGTKRRAAHLQIGRTLLADLGEEPKPEAVLEAVNQLNEGVPDIRDDSERRRLFALNRRAGRIARDAAAFAEAHGYLQYALSLVDEAAWTDEAEAMVAAHLEAAEAAYLVSEFDEMRRLLSTVERVGKPLERAEGARIEALAHLKQGEPKLALAKALRGMETAGVRVSSDPTRLTVAAELVRTKMMLRGKSMEELEAIPRAADENVLAVHDLIGAVHGAAYIARPELFPVLVLKIVQLTLRHGLAPISPFAFASYGLVLVIAFHDTATATRFAKLAMKLAELPLCERYRPLTRFVVYDFIHHWSAPMDEVIEPMYDVYTDAHELGDLETGALSAVVGQNSMFTSGVPLPRIAERSEKYVASLVDQKLPLYMHEVSRQLVLNLMGRASGDACELIGESRFDESAVLDELASEHVGTTMCGYHMCKCLLAFTLGRYELARKHADEVLAFLDALVGSVQEISFARLDALICLHTLPESGKERRRLLGRVRSRMKKLHWAAKAAPMNFGHWLHLVEAEHAHALRNNELALDRFEKAIEGARRHGRLSDEAIACELVGRFHIEQGRETAGRAYLRDAYQRYGWWGAEAKLDVLRQEFPWIASDAVGDRDVSAWATSGQLDALGLLKASQAISGQIVLEDLIQHLMKTVVESAGADRAVLFLTEKDTLEVVARVEDPSEPATLVHQPVADQGGFAESVVRYVDRSLERVVLGDAEKSQRFGEDPHVVASGVRSILCMPIVNRNKSIGLLYLENSLTRDAFSHERVEMLNALSGQIAISLDNARLYERLQTALEAQMSLTTAQSRFVPAQFLQALGRDNIVAVDLGDFIEKELSILFSDIRGFTRFVEGMTPRENIDFINTYLGHMEPAILEHGGFIDSYIGDAIMALFDTEADRAVSAALAMLSSLRALNVERRTRGLKPIETGIGISTGTVMLGTIGGRNRIKCGVIGDNVNLASRVESLTKRYHAALLISDQTFARLADPTQYNTRMVERVRVVGRDAPVTIYEVLDGDTPERSASKLEHRKLFEQATATYYGRELAPALELFEQYVRLVPEDPVPRLYIERCRRYLTQGLDDTWDGVEHLATK